MRAKVEGLLHMGVPHNVPYIRRDKDHHGPYIISINPVQP